jgi:hypothetical protein
MIRLSARAQKPRSYLSSARIKISFHSAPNFFTKYTQVLLLQADNYLKIYVILALFTATFDIFHDESRSGENHAERNSIVYQRHEIKQKIILF